MSDFSVINAWICKPKKNNIVPMFGNLKVKDGKILAFRSKKIKDYHKKHNKVKNKSVYDACGRVLTIPNVNFHDHIYSRLAKGLAITGKMDSFYNILSNYWWKVDKALDLDTVSASAQMAVLESIKNGVTYIFDHHASPNATNGSLQAIAGVLDETSVRGVLCFETSDRNGVKIANAALDENINFVKKFADKNIKAMLGLHASFTLADDTLAEAERIIKDYNLGIHIHLNEDSADRVISKQVSGQFPVARLLKYNLLNIKSILAHGIYLTKREFSKIDENGSAIAFNLDSNLNNSVGLPNFRAMPDSIPIIMGTDGMHANPSRTLKNYFLLMRHSGLSFDEAFGKIHKAYIDQLTFAKRYFSDFTSLNVDDRADFIIWDYVPPTPINKDNFWGHYIYGMLERPIQTTVQHGEFLMKDKKIIGLDENKISNEIRLKGEKFVRKFNRIKNKM